MINYDIGILSFWNIPNYGTFAQEYALQKVIEQIVPDREVRQISHLDKKHYNFYYNHRAYYRSFPIYKKNFWRSFGKKVEVERVGKEIKLKHDRFVNAYNRIPHTEELTKHNINKYQFSNIILGSDIIWDFTQGAFNNDPLLFGLKFNANVVSSYAASFGMASSDAEIPIYVIKGIQRLNNISVRDKNSANIVESVTGERPLIVLDPVWLWDFSNDTNIIQPSENDYILIYGQDFTDTYIENLMVYAHNKKLKTIVLDCNDDNYTWCDVMIKQSDLDPLEWIGYFKGANAIATSTFHGLTFGLLFNKKIAFCKTDFIMAKASALIKNIGIDWLFEDRDDVEKMLGYSWDYSEINKYIDKEKNRSKEYLAKACKGNHE